MTETEQKQFNALIIQIRFQLENVEGWISVNQYEAALIKAHILVHEADQLKAFILPSKKNG